MKKIVTLLERTIGMIGLAMASLLVIISIFTMAYLESLNDSSISVTKDDRMTK